MDSFLKPLQMPLLLEAASRHGLIRRNRGAERGLFLREKWSATPPCG